jgi:hypothetical protein
MRCSDFRGIDDHLGVNGKHIPSDRPCLGTAVPGPPRRFAAARRFGRYRAYRAAVVRWSREPSRAEAFQWLAEQRPCLPLTHPGLSARAQHVFSIESQPMDQHVVLRGIALTTAF